MLRKRISLLSRSSEDRVDEALVEDEFAQVSARPENVLPPFIGLDSWLMASILLGVGRVPDRLMVIPILAS